MSVYRPCTFINNENKHCASGELINEPLPRDGVINAFNPTGSTNNVNELPIMVYNEICENSNCESIRVIDDDQKSLSGVEGRLHDVEINKGVINTEVSVAKNYHNCEPHDSVMQITLLTSPRRSLRMNVARIL